MSGTKQRKQHDRSPTISQKPCHKLFVDYPYPVLNELNKTYKQHKSIDHPHTLVSLQWYKNSFHRMFGVLHNIHSRISPTTIIEESIRQAHIDEHSSKTVANNIQKQTKPTHTRRILASSISPPRSEEEDEEENNQRHVRRIKLTSLNNRIHNDHH